MESRRSHRSTPICLLVLLALVLIALAAPVEGRTAVSSGEHEPVGRLASPQHAVRVAYPEEPTSWSASDGGEPAATDLAALWGLPLYRIDAAGQLRPALADRATVLPGEPGQPWRVQVRLAEGRWSDGEPVVAQDVAATFAALRDIRGEELAPLTDVHVVDSRTVRLVFDRPYARWPYLLAGGLSTLPAHVLRRDGLDAYDGSVPVSGGPFRLAEHEEGLRAVFEAHPSGPLGAPLLERIEVYFTGSYETSLGLLRDRRVDVVLGHLALNPVARAGRLEGIDAAAEVGGTWVALRWRARGDLGDDPAARRLAREAVDLSRFVDGLLAPHGAEMTTTIPGQEQGPWARPEGVDPEALTDEDLRMFVPGDEEVPSLSVRALEPSLSGRGANVEIARVDSRVLYDLVAEDGDGALIVYRDLPRPSLVGQADSPDLLDDLLAADAAPPRAPPARRGQELLHDDATLLPLYRVALAHAWHEELAGIRASSWPGAGFWNAGTWGWRSDQPPLQEPPVEGDS